LVRSVMLLTPRDTSLQLADARVCVVPGRVPLLCPRDHVLPPGVAPRGRNSPLVAWVRKVVCLVVRVAGPSCRVAPSPPTAHPRRVEGDEAVDKVPLACQTPPIHVIT
jgi:hypothetical protein